jgi:hypothetical protein
MKVTPEHNKRMAEMVFASVYPHYVTKVTSKGRTEEELIDAIHWLTGFDKTKIDSLIQRKVNFEIFFNEATLNPNSVLIKGSICGYKIEEIDNELTRNVRYLDKLVDELAKGKALEKIMRV